VSYLISEDAVHELRRSQLLAGQQAPPPRKRYADCNAQLLIVVGDYMLNVMGLTTCVVLPKIFLFKYVVYILTKNLIYFYHSAFKLDEIIFFFCFLSSIVLLD